MFSKMAYAGNVADGLWKAALHLLSAVKHANTSNPAIDPNEESPQNSKPLKKHIKDTIILADETPRKNLFSLFKPLLTTGKRNMVHWSVPFTPIFYIYYIFSMLVTFISALIPVSVPMWIRTLPNPSLAYLYFHHWTFFNTKKSRLVLDFQPSITFEDAINRCQLYYRSLQPRDVPCYSWTGTRCLVAFLMQICVWRKRAS
ncbi:hypothetical protein COOONC_27439 [Cooperia oncophora]